MLAIILRTFLLVTINDAEIQGHIGPVDAYGRKTVIRQSILIGDSHLYGAEARVSNSLLIGRVFTTGKVTFRNTYIIGKLNTIEDK